MSKPKILIVDDEKPLRDTLARWFAKAYDCQTAPDAAAAMKIVAATPDLALVLTDFKMPEKSGLDLAREAKAVRPDLAVIILTAHADVNLVIEAMRNGVDDFFQKPVTDLSQLELRIQKAIKTAALEKEVSELKSQLGGELENFTGKSPAMEKVYRLIRKVAPTNATVLVEGPSGSGKELAARALHTLSARAKGPFVAVECAALSKDLLESELFGYAPEPLPADSRTGRPAASKPPRAERSFSTRSARSTRGRKSSSCARSNRGPSSASDPPKRCRSTSAWSPPPTATFSRWSPRDSSAKTSSTG